MALTKPADSPAMTNHSIDASAYVASPNRPSRNPAPASTAVATAISTIDSRSRPCSAGMRMGTVRYGSSAAAVPGSSGVAMLLAPSAVTSTSASRPSGASSPW